MKLNLRTVSISLYPLFLTVSLLLARPTLRRVLIFLLSFSFQTTALGWIYLIIVNPELGKWASLYTSFVALVWAIFLGGKETDTGEWLFNFILHYVFPIITVVAYLPHRKKVATTASIYGILYPTAYMGFLLISESKLGYPFYPVLRENPFTLYVLWVAMCSLFLR